MKIIGSLTSPYARKVRIVLAEKKIEADFVPENVWVPETTIGQHNPLGKIPCLVTDDGSAIFDSRVIVEYVDTLSPVGKLIPADGRERAAVKTWEALADGILDAGILARLEATWRPAEQQSPAWIERQMSKIDAALKTMSIGLGESNYCHHNQFSLADIAVGCALGYLDFRFPSLDWRTPHPNLAAFYQGLMQRQSFKDTVPPAA
ncbi:glutathione S-transferase [Polynucleobacter difficilis]|uniref:glutathione S-transferase n=1 Tax=Polynucleobacter difficilis TaxID=556054 RepID=UPI000D3D5D20|nr:glutathione S-transferase [Polynucleobacter difficilis]